MTEANSVRDAFLSLPALLERQPVLLQRGRFLNIDCLLGSTEMSFHVLIRDGRIVEMVTAPVIMRSWAFAYRATPEAWQEFWQPMPKPGFHDLLSMTKRGVGKLEGDVYPFLTNLQYFKDLLALPRSAGGQP